MTSDDKGAAAYYAAYGIASDVYCQAESEDDLYVGTFYKDQLKTGEGDSTQMELYPCNNLQLRRAAYAYLYLKKPDGTPYKGSITFCGGVYVNGEYKESARFTLQGTGQNVNQPGDQDQKVSLGADGKLEVVMDQTQWGLEGNSVSAGDDIRYVFQIEQGSGTGYYPLLVTIDANANEDAFVGSGEAIVSFRTNTENGEHPFIASQIGNYSNAGSITNLLGITGNVGPSDSTSEAKENGVAHATPSLENYAVFCFFKITFLRPPASPGDIYSYPNLLFYPKKLFYKRKFFRITNKNY